MKASTATLPNGRTVRLGRIPPKAIFKVGGYTVVVRNDGSHQVLPNFAPHYHPQLDKTPPPTSTNWLAKCQAAIARPYSNLTWGDCVIASLLHMIGGWTGNETGTPALSNDAQAVKTYHRVCGPGDQGCDITAVLNTCQTVGVPCGAKLHKIAGYVTADNTNQNEISVCVEVFGPALKLGINLPSAWMSAARGNGFVWDVTNTRSVGGHDVPIIDYDSTQGVRIATWGMWGWITWPALADTRIVQECYCSLGKDWYSKNNLAPNGINAATLAADLKLLGGGTTPPVPGGGPTPPAPPAPVRPPHKPTRREEMLELARLGKAILKVPGAREWLSSLQV